MVSELHEHFDKIILAICFISCVVAWSVTRDATMRDVLLLLAGAIAGVSQQSRGTTE